MLNLLPNTGAACFWYSPKASLLQKARCSTRLVALLPSLTERLLEILTVCKCYEHKHVCMDRNQATKLVTELFMELGKQGEAKSSRLERHD